MEQKQIVKVRLLSATKATDREFDYLCPDFVTPTRGSVVKIPFGKGNRVRFGVVCAVTNKKPERECKSILEVVDEKAGLTEELLSLCDHLKEQIFCTFGEAAKAILPAPVYQKSARSVRFLSLSEGVDPENALVSFRGKNKEKYLEVLRYLSLTGEVAEKTCRDLFDLDGASFSLLEKKGLLRIWEKERARNPLEGLEKSNEKEHTLSHDQKRALEELKEVSDCGKAGAALLYGITGSGKTEVMLALCDHVLKKNKTVIFLVPEIALTGQSAKLLFQRYGDRVALIHSALSEGERRDAYVSIRSGEKPIVLGTRSAVFAPLSDLGLIVIDEEQDQSYKSDTQLKYHARDVARFRCAKNDAMLLLASATPSVESFHKAKEGIYKLVSMTTRFGSACLPEVEIVDLRPDLRKNPGILMGRRLRREIGENLERGDQTILLMNRRGYRRFVSCTACGEVIRCPHCSVSMTLHNGERKRLSCHYCGYAIPLPDKCPSCGSEHLVPHGYGIQQLEEELAEVFPKARVLRMDSDSLSGKGSHEKLLTAFRNKEADILIGTQMVAKGHNFPDVTLVGIVMADSSLYMSDFRAAEHSFSLLTQVIGRAGRAQKKGRALIQTLNPAHNVFSLAAEQDYDSFFEGEIALRRAFQFPPFCQLALLTLADEKEEKVLLSSREMEEEIRSLLKGEFQDVKMIVYGPFEAPVYRLKNIYRKRFIIKYKNTPRSRLLFERLLTRFSDPKYSGARVTADIGPGVI